MLDSKLSLQLSHSLNCQVAVVKNLQELILCKFNHQKLSRQCSNDEQFQLSPGTSSFDIIMHLSPASAAWALLQLVYPQDNKRITVPSDHLTVYETEGHACKFEFEYVNNPSKYLILSWMVAAFLLKALGAHHVLKQISLFGLRGTKLYSMIFGWLRLISSRKIIYRNDSGREKGQRARPSEIHGCLERHQVKLEGHCMYWIDSEIAQWRRFSLIDLSCT